jgi:hypothetical protein
MPEKNLPFHVNYYEHAPRVSRQEELFGWQLPKVVKIGPHLDSKLVHN